MVVNTRGIFLFFFLLLNAQFTEFCLQAQDVSTYRLDETDVGKPLPEVLQKIGEKSNSRFFYLPEWIQPIRVGENYKELTLAEALTALFQGTELKFIVKDPHTIVLVKDPTNLLLHKEAREKLNEEKKPVAQKYFGDNQSPITSGLVAISGKVVDAKTGDPMPNATILVSDPKYNTTTNDLGQFTLKLIPGIYLLTFSFVDFESQVVDIAAYGNGELSLQLEKAAVVLEEVVIQGQSTQDNTSSRIGKIELTMKELKRAPTFLGEADLVKQVQLLPGVTTTGEAATGFNVRGGSVDQNLILYDGMPVFNSSHAFGFLTAFNSEAIREVAFYKGGIPAEYGGRVSSVLDIQSKEGDYQKWGGKAGIGMVTGNLMINGPIKKGKTALIATLRSTYSDWLVHAIKTDYADLSNSSVSFYDATIKLTHKFTDRTKLSVASYSSNDSFRLLGDSTYKWSNFQTSARVDHQFSDKLNAEFIAGVSSFGYSVNNSNYLTASELSYKITTTSLKAGFIYQRPNRKWNMGWQVMHYSFQPGKLEPLSPVSSAKPVSLANQYSIENAFYASTDWTLSNSIFVDFGLRIPTFISFGAAEINTYQSGVPRDITTVQDTLRFGSGEIIKAYAGLEPRLSVRWVQSPTASVKFGYNRMYQYLHLVTNTTAVTPVDIWQPSGYYFEPQRADQFSIGYFKDFKENKYSTSIETFYKDIDQLIDFKDGAQLILNKHLETDLLQGKGYSYGVETTFSKNTGRLTWSFNYTYSRSFRQIQGNTLKESINKGKEYPSNFDQPHIINLSWKYNLTKRVFFTGNFTYRSGRPITVPIAAFQLENTTVTYYSERNQYRIPDYHRLDFALVIEGNQRRRKLFDATWVFSVYNVYGRQNPYTIFFRNSVNGVPVPYQLSIVGAIFPSISYNIKF
jgi:outer membrane cobalamin receptor